MPRYARLPARSACSAFQLGVMGRSAQLEKVIRWQITSASLGFDLPGPQALSTIRATTEGGIMKVSDLFSAEPESDLTEWVKKFAALGDLYSAMPQLYAKLRVSNVQGAVEDGASIIGPVHIGRGSIVHGQAIIRGPAIVGNDTVINSHVEIREGSFIGSKCVIGHSCSIIESIIMGNVTVCGGTFIRKSVIGFGSVIGPGAALGAQEVERPFGLVSAISTRGVALGDYAVIGANSTIKSGTVIGSRTIIGECVLADGVYGPNQTVRSRQVLEVKARSRSGC
jgi:carbonic anhydrase/acetyltransferase-like protein (isoleucine patch superfamily)